MSAPVFIGFMILAVVISTQLLAISFKLDAIVEALRHLKPGASSPLPICARCGKELREPVRSVANGTGPKLVFCCCGAEVEVPLTDQLAKALSLNP